MADAALQRRPAVAGLTLPYKDGVARVGDLGPACRLVYRGPPGHLAGAFAVALPAEPCRSAVAGEEAALWLGPDEWLLIAPEARRASLIDDLRAAIGGRAASLVDVSQGLAGFPIEGPQAARVLNAGCPLDLDPVAFPVGMCTRTLLAKAEIILWRTAADAFRLEVGRSLAPYVVGVLSEALRDIG